MISQLDDALALLRSLEKWALTQENNYYFTLNLAGGNSQYYYGHILVDIEEYYPKRKRFKRKIAFNDTKELQKVAESLYYEYVYKGIGE